MNNFEILTSVVIPTVRRPQGLVNAIESVLAQTGVNGAETEVLIVDNDPAGSAKGIVQRYANAVLPVRYVCEPDPGVANARNTAIAHCRGKLVVFLDDDQTAPETWLASMLATHDRYGAAVTFGPVITSLPQEDLPHAIYLKRFFARTGPEKSGLIDMFYGCGNSLLDLSQMPETRPLFDVKANETGGEDDFLFSRLESLGKTFGWAVDAPVFEHVPASRATLKYTLRRTFAYGQAPTTICANKSPPNVPGIIFWTLVGLGQTLVFGMVSLFMMIIRSDTRAIWYDKTSQGLGKMLWFGPFEQRFYGRHAS